MEVKHRPILKIQPAIKEISAREGVPVKYVATTDIAVSDQPVDVFYRETPHPKFGNQYFGIRYNEFAKSFVICSAENIKDLTFGMIQDDLGLWHYSQSRHDYLQVGDSFIDGGRDYVRAGSEYKLFEVVDGEFVECG